MVRNVAMKTRLIYWLAVSLACACGGSEAGPETGSGSLKTEAQFCQAWATNACNADVVAFCDPGADGPDTCIASQAAFCESLVPSFYDPTNAKVCLDAVKAAYADADLSSEELETVRHLAAPCDHLIKGSGGANDWCAETADCNTLEDLVCVIKAGDTSGTCQVPAEVGGGQRCTGADQVCAEGFYCDGSNCIAYKDLGDACEFDDQCPPDQRCDAAVCVERKAAGDDCASDAECQSRLCAIPHGAVSGVCVSAVRLSAESALCEDLR
jgi:hypothetical protein